MRLVLSVFLLAALSWPALAQQDQSQTPPATTPPPASQAPTQPSTPAGAQQPPATEAPPASAKSKKRKSSKKKRKRPAKHTKEQPKEQADTAAAGPHRVVVRHGSTGDTGGQLEPGISGAEAAHQRQGTEQLLQSTDANLKNIARRKLTPDQQDMVRQITFYMEQSRSADKEGDLERARNLATKAHMLSDELARH